MNYADSVKFCVSLSEINVENKMFHPIEAKKEKHVCVCACLCTERKML